MRMRVASKIGFRAILVAALAAVAGCGALQQPLGGQVVRYEYKRPDGRAFVRIEQIEHGAPPNDHPATLRPDQVRLALASVREKNAQVFGADEPVFDAVELDEIATPLAAALAAATPAQDVTFAVIGSHGLFGERSPPTATTGRAFIRGASLNIVFGLVGSAYESIDISGTRNQVAPGQRNVRVEYGWTLTAPGAQLVDARGDWLAFDIAGLSQAAARSAMPAAAHVAPVAPVAPPAAVDSRPASQAVPAPAPAPRTAEESRYQDVATKLRILDRLHADKLVSDEEYRERRRAILQGL